MSIITNTICTLIYGSILENMIGFKQTAGTYFISALGGIALSLYAAQDDVAGLGPAGATTGLLSGQLAVIFVNWNEFDGNQQMETMRCCGIFIVSLILILNLSFALS